MLEDKLGELASNYKLSSELTIEKAQLRFLNYFLDSIESQHLSDLLKFHAISNFMQFHRTISDQARTISDLVRGASSLLGQAGRD